MAARKTASKSSPASSSKASGSKAGGSKASSAKPSSAKPAATKETPKAGAAKAGASKASSSAKKPPPDLAGRIDGLRGWLDQIEHKQSRQGLFGGIGLLIAIAGAAAGLYLGVTTHNDAATKSDLAKLSSQVAALKTEVDQASQGKKSITQTLSSLQQQLQSLQAKQAQQAQQISALRNTPAATPTVPALTTPKAPTVTKP